MQLQSPIASGLRHTAARGLRAIADVRRNHPVTRRRSRRRVTAMRRYKYQALVTLSSPEDGGLDAEPSRHVRRLAVRAYHRETHRSVLFSSLVTAADGSLLRPGTADIIATMVVLGDDVGDYLAPGEPFALLSGSEVGHGVVTSRLFT